MIQKHPTSCCALAHLTMTSDTDKQEIEEIINLLKEEKRVQDWYGTDSDAGGQTAVFTITTPFEEELAKNLEEFGFKKVNEFDRRNGYGGEGLLSMWVYNIPDLDTLDISNLQSIDDIDLTKYLDKENKQWIRHIKYPVSQDDLDNICNISDGKLINSMGDLYLNQ